MIQCKRSFKYDSHLSSLRIVQKPIITIGIIDIFCECRSMVAEDQGLDDSVTRWILVIVLPVV